MKRPFDADIRIIPGDPGIVRARVESRDFVGNLGIGLKRGEAVGKADRREELLAALRCQHGGDKAAEGRRGAANIDSDVENGAARKVRAALSFWP